MEFIDEILGVNKPDHQLVESLAEQYSAIAFRFGYFEAQSPCWLYFMKKDGSSAAFEVQFGNVSEFKSSLERLVKSKSELCFLVTSSLAHTLRTEETKGLLLRNFEIGKQKFIILDIETGRALRINFEWEDFQRGMTSGQSPGQERFGKPIFREQRKKKIFGKRGQHKVQD